MMADDWIRPKTPRERKTMVTRAQTPRIIMMCAYGLMTAVLSVVIILPLYGISVRYTTNITDSGRLLPLQTHYVYDTNNSPLYELTYASQAIGIFTCTLPYTGIDNFLGLLIFHICGQIEILRHRLTHLDKVANFADALNSCVVDHVRLLRAIVIIEDTFNILLLVLFLYFGILFALYGVLIVGVSKILFALYGVLIVDLFENGNYLSLSGLTYLMTIVPNAFGHMCLYCVLGEILTAQCNRIHYDVYSNKWYTMEPRNARNIIPVMVRTRKPLYLTVGKVFPLTMATFCNLLKTSAGYISVLLTTRN